MHKNVLLALDRDQFKSFDYSLNPEKAIESLGENSGNNVFQYSLQRIISKNKHNITVDTSLLHMRDPHKITEYTKHINDNYDCVVYSPANVLSVYANDDVLPRFTSIINQITVPVYAIGLGAQSDRFYSTAYVDSIRENAFKYIKAILDGGGKLGLRGYFTADVLKKLGFSQNDFSVIGCPSLYMHGPNLNININGNFNDQFTAINGFRAWNSKSCQEFLKKNQTSFFVCQDEFYKLLYNNRNYDWKEFQYLADSDEKWLQRFLHNQIALYCDFPSWIRDLRERGVSFSLGCRIHGNVVPLLAGIPAYIDLFDSRVKELSEYFNIPGSYLDDGFEPPLKLIEKTDYTVFNREFKTKYHIFEEFMHQCGLAIDPTQQDAITKKYSYEFPSKQYVIELSQKLKKPKRVVFVAHEFGLFPGHGGIASYLYNITSYLLKLPNIEVFILAPQMEIEESLKENTRFNPIKICGDLNKQRKQVFEALIEISPDYVEIADYLALGLFATIEKQKTPSLKKAILVTNNHTATRECWEWTNIDSFINAPTYLQHIYLEEKEQMQFSDYCIAPSSFLAKYVKEKYALKNEIMVFANPYIYHIKTKDEILKDVQKYYDIEEFKNAFNIVLISRFERRKQQERLLDAFSRLKSDGFSMNLFLIGNSCEDQNGIDYREYLIKKYIYVQDCYFFEYLDLEEQNKFIAIADLSVLPSTYENQPIAMIETCLRGIPVMASIHSGVADYTPDRELLFDPFKNDDLYEKIHLFYNMTKNERNILWNRQYTALKEFISPEKSIINRISLSK